MLETLMVFQKNHLFDGLLFGTKMKNFPFQIISLISVRSKMKENYVYLTNEMIRVFHGLFEKTLSAEKNQCLIDSISYKFISSLVAALTVQLKEDQKSIEIFKKRGIKCLDLSFSGVSFNLGFFFSMQMKRQLNEKRNKLIQTNYEELFPFAKMYKNTLDYLIESNQDSKIIDSFGVILFEKKLIRYQKENFSGKKRIMEIVFHTSRKFKNQNNVIALSKWFKTKARLIHSIKEIQSLSGRACAMFSLEKLEIISLLGLEKKQGFSVKWSKKWIKNFFHYKISFYKTLNTILDAKSLVPSVPEKKEFFKKKIIGFDLTIPFLLGKSSFSKHFNIDCESYSFLTFLNYIDQISNGLSNINESLETFSNELSLLKNFNEKNYPEFFKKESVYQAIGFVFSLDIFKGLKVVKEKIMAEILNYSPPFSEYKIIICLTLLGSFIFSDRLTTFMLKNTKIKYVSAFFLTGDIFISKNLESLIFGSGILFSTTQGFLSKNQFNRLNLNFNTIISLGIQRNKKIKNSFTKIIKNKLRKYSINNILGLTVFSFCFTYFNYIEGNTLKFIKGLSSILTSFDDRFFFDVKQKYFRVYIPLAVGLLFFGKKRLSSLITIHLKFIKNKKIRLIFCFFINICAFIGTSDTRQISSILKDFENYYSIKTRKSQRFHLIQREIKQNQEDFFPEKKIISINENEGKRTFYFLNLKIKIGILGLAIISFNDEDTIQLIFRVFSYFFSNNDLECSRTSVLTFGLVFISRPDSSLTDFLIKLTGSKDWKTVKNSIFSLGLIGAGTNNSRIINTFKHLGAFYFSKIEFFKNHLRLSSSNRTLLLSSKIRSIISILRISQGLTRSSKNFITYSSFLKKDTFDFIKITSLICIIQSFSESSFMGLESTPIIIFLFILLMQSKMISSFDKNLKIKSLLIKTKKFDSQKKKFKFTPFLQIESNENWFEAHHQTFAWGIN